MNFATGDSNQKQNKAVVCNTKAEIWNPLLRLPQLPADSVLNVRAPQSGRNNLAVGTDDHDLWDANNAVLSRNY